MFAVKGPHAVQRCVLPMLHAHRIAVARCLLAHILAAVTATTWYAKQLEPCPAVSPYLHCTTTHTARSVVLNARPDKT